MSKLKEDSESKYVHGWRSSRSARETVMARWLALWSIVLVAVTWRTGVATTAQTRGAAAFEVASVKPVKPEFPLQRPFACVFGTGGRFRAFGTLQMLIACAYRIPAALNERQISGGPKWLTVDLFDIEAKSPPEQVPGSPAESLVMLQTLKLKSAKGSIEMIIVDHAEHPTTN
jgi:hypothetical protein